MKFFKILQGFLGFVLVLCIQWVFKLLSYRRVSDIGSVFGYIFEKIGFRRKVAIENILLSSLYTDPAVSSEWVSKSYRNLGRTFCELLTLKDIQLKKSLDYELILPEGFYEHIQGGAVFISAHTGNWELMGKILTDHKIPLAVVVKRQGNVRIDHLINRQREKSGMRVVYAYETVRLLSLLKEKYCIALLSDQDFGDNKVPVHFLGRPCFAPEGPVFFAKKFQMPLFICFALRLEKYYHRFEIRAFEYDGSLPDTILVQSYTSEIEKIISAHPDQWLWHHRRWKVHA